MRKVIGIGETILDIIFKDEQPTAAVPGGSSFNAIISVGRAGIPTTFISETGDDRVGRMITRFMEANGVSSKEMTINKGTKSPVSLAFLNAQNDAEYIFYKDHPNDNPIFTHPVVNADDIILFGSYYAVNPVIREQVGGFLEYAHSRGAILYYDVNFRKAHVAELPALLPTILENFALSTVIRGSTEDFGFMFGQQDVDALYREKIQTYCPNFISTSGSEPIEVRTPVHQGLYPVKPVDTVSTIGAGDNFNAGFIYGLLKYGVKRDDLACLGASGWAKLVACGQLFSANVCASVDNYIDVELGKSLRLDL